MIPARAIYRKVILSALLLILLSTGLVGVAVKPALADSSLCQGSNYSTCTNAGYTDHGYFPHSGTSYWAMDSGHNCTNYVAYAESAVNGAPAPSYNLGDAYLWGPNASSHGVTVDGTPGLGSVAWWAASYHGAGSSGHVAYVESVNSDGSVTVSEDNFPSGPFDWRIIAPGSGSWPSGFIHFQDLTGGTVQSGPDDPKGNFEAMTQVSAGVRLTGWALDPDTSNPIEVDVYEGPCCANPRGAFTANVSRPDVGSAWPGYGDNHGFDITLALPEGITGSKTYCAYAINVGAGSISPSLGCRTVTFTWNPIGNFENIRRVPGGVHLSGWTLDFDTSNPLETDVYEGTCCTNPRGAFTANISRPDVAAAFPGSGDAHGFEIDIGAAPPSTTTKTYCVYAINVSYGNTSPQLGCRSITISPDATGSFDSIQAVPGGAEVVGWTLDQDTASSTEVDLYEGTCCTYPIGAFTADQARPDVGTAWPGYGDDHGFDITVPLSPGTHTVCAYGINSPGTAGNNVSLGCKTVAVT